MHGFMHLGILARKGPSLAFVGQGIWAWIP